MLHGFWEFAQNFKTIGYMTRNLMSHCNSKEKLPLAKYFKFKYLFMLIYYQPAKKASLLWRTFLNWHAVSPSSLDAFLTLFPLNIYVHTLLFPVSLLPSIYSHYAFNPSCSFIFCSPQKKLLFACADLRPLTCVSHYFVLLKPCFIQIFTSLKRKCLKAMC